MLLPHLIDGQKCEVGEGRHATHVSKHEVYYLAIIGAGDEGEVADRGSGGEQPIGGAENLIARLGVD